MRVKCTKERCKQCQYAMNLSSATSIAKNKESHALIACGYILKTGKSRAYENGQLKKNYEPGYCNYYVKGKRLSSLDDISNHTTLKKGGKKRVTA